jgi:hypothetical protein
MATAPRPDHAPLPAATGSSPVQALRLVAALEQRHRTFHRVLGPLPAHVQVHLVNAATGLLQVSGLLDAELVHRLAKALAAVAQIPFP